LPKDLPEFLEIDMSEMQMNDIKRLSDIPLPAGVSLVALSHGRDEPVVSIHHPRAEEVETPAAADAAAAAPAAGAAAPAAGAAAAPAAGGDAKKAAAPAAAAPKAGGKK
jgi:large subunit ribosomal protein L25